VHATNTAASLATRAGPIRIPPGIAIDAALAAIKATPSILLTFFS